MQSNDQEILSLYAGGASIRTVAASVGMGYSSVRKILHSHGVVRGHGDGNRINVGADRIAKMKRLYGDGWTATDIGDLFGVSQHKVLSTLRNAGVAIRKNGHSKTLAMEARIKDLGFDETKIVKMYSCGMGLEAIGDVVGISAGSVKKILTRRGVPLTPRNAATIQRMLAQEQIDEIASMHAAGKSVREMAAGLPVSQVTIRRHLYDLGLLAGDQPSYRGRQKGKKFTPVSDADRAVAIEMHAAGKSAADIGDALGIAESTARRHLALAGVRISRSRVSADDIATMQELYADGQSMSAIGKKLGLSKHTVRSRLIAAGTELRSKSDAQKLAAARRLQTLTETAEKTKALQGSAEKDFERILRDRGLIEAWDLRIEHAHNGRVIDFFSPARRVAIEVYRTLSVRRHRWEKNTLLLADNVSVIDIMGSARHHLEKSADVLQEIMDGWYGGSLRHGPYVCIRGGQISRRDHEWFRHMTQLAANNLARLSQAPRGAPTNKQSNFYGG